MGNPINPAKQTAVNQLITTLSAVLTSLLTAARATADDTVLAQLNSEYSAIQTILNQASQAQMAADDALFSQATAAVKAQASLLQGMEVQITKIVADVTLAGKIAGYITQALTLIAKL